jgi:hypothetical protein
MKTTTVLQINSVQEAIDFLQCECGLVIVALPETKTVYRVFALDGSDDESVYTADELIEKAQEEADYSVLL